MTVPIPDDSARKRTVLIASVVTVAVVLVGVGIAFAVMAQRAPKAAPTVTRPVEETSSTSSAESSAASLPPSGSVESTITSSTIGATEASSSPLHTGQIVRAAKIAFRLANTVYVASEDGSGKKPIFTSALHGKFALSPDGTTLAIVDESSTTGVMVIDVTTGRQLRIPGAVDLPAWSPDSTWLAYTTETSSVPSLHRIIRDGTGAELLVTPGAEPKFSADGHAIAYVASSQPIPQTPRVFDLSTRTSKVVPGAKNSLDYAWKPDGSLYFLQAGSTGNGVISYANKALTHATKLVTLPSPSTTSTVLVPAGLLPSPDGTRIVLTDTGDDGYSRMLAVTVATGQINSLTTHFDAYPWEWTADGKAILYVLGNALQGEKTSLYRMAPDGSGNRMIVSGASQ